jgi:hypothetical protein
VLNFTFHIAVIISLLSQHYLVPCSSSDEDEKESNEPDYDEDKDQLEEEQQEETEKITIREETAA